MSKVLIIGAHGKVARQAAPRLAAAGHEVVELDTNALFGPLVLAAGAVGEGGADPVPGVGRVAPAAAQVAAAQPHEDRGPSDVWPLPLQGREHLGLALIVDREPQRRGRAHLIPRGA